MHNQMSGLASASLMSRGEMGRSESEKLKAAIASQCVEKLPQPREIPDKIDVLYGSTEYLSERVAHLEGRLQRVLIARPPESDSNRNSAGASTDLGMQLSAVIARLQLISEAVESITARLEL